MLFFKLYTFKLFILFYLILFNTVSVYYLTKDSVSSFIFKDYLTVMNALGEDVNSSLLDFNSTNTMGYETVVVRVASPIDVYMTPCLIILGIGGNMLALYVFFSSKLRHQSTSQYLSALAISDSLFLGELFPPWLSTIDINGVFHRVAYCKAFVYISYVACCLSAWLVIAFTVERFVAVQFPLQRPSVCTVRRARYVIVSLTVASMLVNLPVIHFAGIENEQCNIDRDKLDLAAKFNWVDTTVTFTIPLMLIILFNTWIAAVIYKLKRNRIKLTQEELCASGPGQHGSHDSEFLYLRSQRRITNMLLIVSTIFVLFNCPAYTLRVCGYVYDMDSGELDEKWLTAQNVATMMFNANFGINFFLYCLTGQNFRRALVQTVPCFGWLARKINRVFKRSNDTKGRTFSVTTSAASAGTDATLADSSFFRRLNRRAHHPSGKYIMRWKFDNSRQHRETAVSDTSESIQMQDLDPQPGPSRFVPDDLQLPGTCRNVATVRTQAIIETRIPGSQMKRAFNVPKSVTSVPRRLAEESNSPVIRPWQASDDEPRVSRNKPCLPTVESSSPAIRPGRASNESRISTIRPGRPILRSSSPAIRPWRASDESMISTIRPGRPMVEPSSPAIRPWRASDESRISTIRPDRPIVESRSPAGRPWRINDEVRLSTITPCQVTVTDSGSPIIDYRRPITDRRTVISSRRPLVVTRGSNIDLRRTANDSSFSTLELMRPTAEPTRSVLKRSKAVPKRKSCCF